MKLTIYIQDNCDFCKELNIPEDLNIEQIYINRDGFEGFKPSQVPVMQYDGINFDGPYAINSILKLAKDAKEGNYNK